MKELQNELAKLQKLVDYVSSMDDDKLKQWKGRLKEDQQICYTTVNKLACNQASLCAQIDDLKRFEEEELQSQVEGLQPFTENGVTKLVSEDYISSLKQKEESERNISLLRERLEKHKEKLDSLKNLTKSQHQQMNHLQSKTREQYNLLTSLSLIKWDDNAPENLIKGFVLQRKKRDLIPFSLDKDTNSQFFITNFLWNLISLDHETLQ